MFDIKSRQRRSYAKAIIKQSVAELRRDPTCLSHMLSAFPHAYACAVGTGTLSVEVTNQPSRDLRDALHSATYNPSEKLSELAAQQCILISKKYKMSQICEKIPSLLFAAYFKLNADSSFSLQTPKLSKMEERIVLSNQLIDMLGDLADEHLVQVGKYYAH